MDSERYGDLCCAVLCCGLCVTAMVTVTLKVVNIALYPLGMRCGRRRIVESMIHDSSPFPPYRQRNPNVLLFTDRIAASLLISSISSTALYLCQHRYSAVLCCALSGFWCVLVSFYSDLLLSALICSDLISSILFCSVLLCTAVQQCVFHSHHTTPATSLSPNHRPHRARFIKLKMDSSDPL
jgi:hypothetical protein